MRDRSKYRFLPISGLQPSQTFGNAPFLALRLRLRARLFCIAPLALRRSLPNQDSLSVCYAYLFLNDRQPSLLWLFPSTTRQAFSPGYAPRVCTKPIKQKDPAEAGPHLLFANRAKNSLFSAALDQRHETETEYCEGRRLGHYIETCCIERVNRSVAALPVVRCRLRANSSSAVPVLVPT